MTQFYSRVDATLNGDVYSIPFSYTKEEEIHVYVNNEIFTNWYFLNESQIKLNEIPADIPNDAIISIRRVTDISEKAVDYTNNTMLAEEALNLAQDQLLYAVQEIYDNNVQFEIDALKSIQDNKEEILGIIETNEQEILDTQSEFQQQTNAAIKEFEDGIDAKIETVADAADRINDLDADLAIATNAAVQATQEAQNAAQQAQIAIEKAEEITNAKEEVLNVAQDITEANEQFKNEIESELENKANLDLSNLSEVGEKHFLGKSQITNCITEIPQRIKLELNNGTLTLKAGSVVTVPNGFEADGTTLKFDYVTIKEDIVRNAVGFANSNSSLVFFSPDTNIIFDRSEEICFSGTTTPTGSYATWYDSNTNTIKNTNTSGSTWTSGYSLPFALVKSNDNSFASIEQTFNALGYMGSSFWINKDVKVLLRNGKNEDGTYKNIELVIPKIQMKRTTSTSAIGYKLTVHTDLGSGIFDGWWDGRVFEQVEEPTIWSYGGSIWINPETNISKYHPEDDNADWVELPSAIIGTGNRLEGGKVGNFKVKQAFRAIDYNDKTAIGSWAMPSNKYIDLTLGASNTVYTAPANGWVWLQMQSAAAGQGVSLHSLPTPSATSSSACITSRVYSSATTQYLATNIPVRKGQSFVASYTATGTAGKYFRFCYAEGEV